MKPSFPLFASTSLAAPVARAWMMVPSPSSSDLFFKSPSEMIREQRAMMDQMFSDQLSSFGGIKNQQQWSSGPRGYEVITNDDNKLALAMNLPDGVKMEDVNVEYNDKTNLLTVSGKQHVEEENYQFSSQFSQSISLDPATVELDKLDAAVQDDGVLILSAPKKVKALKAEEDNKRKIPIKMLTKEDGSKKEEVQGKTEETATP